MPAKTKTPPAIKPPERKSTMQSLYDAVLDVRIANNKAARPHCRRCGIGDSYNLDAAISRLLRVVLELPGDDLDLLIIEPDDE